MDSPSNALTNVLKIDNLSRVPYATYTLAISVDDFIGPDEDRQCDILRDAERTLRAEGVPVLSDLENNCLWVFHIAGITRVSASAEEGEILVDDEQPADEKDERWLQIEERLSEEWGLKELSRDIFHSSSLTLPLQAPLTTPFAAITIDPMNTAPPTPKTEVIDLTLDDEPRPADPPPPETPEERNARIYRYLLTSVIAVLTFHLSLHSGFTPLNARTLVSPSSLPTSISKASSNGKDTAGKSDPLPSSNITSPELATPLVLSLDAYLTTVGTLLITPSSTKQQAIRRLGSSGYTDNSWVERECFIAPWGEWGRIIPPSESESPILPASESRWKESVISYLKDHGIISPISLEDGKKSDLQEAIEKGTWREIEIWLTNGDGTGNIHRIVWPESLLFIKHREGDKKAALPASTSAKDDFWKNIWDAEYSQLAWGKLSTLFSGMDFNFSYSGSGSSSNTNEELNAGVEWWHVPSALDFGLEWYKGRESRAQKIQERMEEKAAEEKMKQKVAHLAAEAEKAKQLKSMGIGIGIGVGPVGGVYPTPPDAQGVLLGGPASAASTGAAETPGFIHATMEDWSAQGDPAVNAETDLFGDEEMDGMLKVTDDDFAFFDNNDGFGDDAGGMDMDMDLVMSEEKIEIPPTTLNGGGLVPEVMVDNSALTLPTISGQQQQQQQNQQNQPQLLSQQQKSRKRQRDTTEPPTVSLEAKNQVQTPPLSPHRAMSLLVPGYSPPNSNYTPPNTGLFKVPQLPNANTTSPDGHVTKRRASMYSPIVFTDNVEKTDMKYAPGGRFFLAESDTKTPAKEDATRIDRSFLKRKRSTTGHSTGRSTATHSRTPREGITIDDDDTTLGSVNGDISEESDADDTSDEESEDEGEENRYHTSPSVPSVTGPLSFMMPWGGKKRKWPIGSVVDDAMSIDSPASRSVVIGVEGDVEVIPELAPAPWKLMKPDSLDDSLVGVFSSMTITSDPLSAGTFGDAEYVEVATVLAGQLTGFLHSVWNGKPETITVEDEAESSSSLLLRRRCKDQSLVEDAVRTLFNEGNVIRCSLETYASITDSIQAPAPIPPPPPLSSHLHGGISNIKPNPALSQRRNNTAPSLIPAKPWDIFPLPPPHIRLQRGDNILELLPPALHFWETFSLAPISGGKNVIACCFHPSSPQLAEAADFLLDRMTSSYEAGRFGIHHRAEIPGIASGGMIPIPIPREASPNYEVAMTSLLSHLEGFGPVLANSIADEGQNIVIYLINPFLHPSALVDIATGFVRLKRHYLNTIATIPGAKPNHLSLQIIPASFVAHKLGQHMRVNIIHKLCQEVYSRCIRTDESVTQDPRENTPSVVLSRPLPQTINFSITEPSPGLLKENRLLHLVYAQSSDERWAAAAWSDNTGEVERRRVMNLGRKGSGYLRPFRDVLKELWMTTQELLKSAGVKTRLCITRLLPCGSGSGSIFPADESILWQTITHPRISSLHLLTATLSSPLHLSEVLPEINLTTFFPQQTLLTPMANTPTPGATGNSIVSPDASVTTPGNGADTEALLDADAELVDVNEEIWGVVVGHVVGGVVLAPDIPPLQHQAQTQAQSGKGIKTLLSSTSQGKTGLLIKRDIKEEGWKVVLQITAVKGEEVLREVLEGWRGLGVLGAQGIPAVMRFVEGVEGLGIL
ncbi:mediator complex subunit 13 C-terminal-domain-containing protein [Pyronema omphalodes]|nr:mediator complex subunit 13 C-terminal-domain-containing protein [Pyronema omphalodes]